MRLILPMVLMGALVLAVGLIPATIPVKLLAGQRFRASLLPG
jgi:hypothetical protein